MKVAVVGATGMVGRVMLDSLTERNFPLTELIPVASEKSIGKHVLFNGNEYAIIGIQEAIEKKPDIAIFSAGGNTSLQWAPEFAKNGTVVIDNSSAWRMNPEHRLVVPEVNANVLSSKDKIIANPNCSTIQLVMVLQPLHQKFVIKRVVVSTYQSISGSGSQAVLQMDNERKDIQGKMAYPYPIDKNCIPHCDIFQENGYTKEEMKVVEEPKKIMNNESLKITATAVRVPVVGGHSESVNIEFEKPFDVNDVRNILHQADGIVLQDNPDTNIYPMPLYASNKDDVFVGRIRRDESQPNSLNLWIVSDNLRKGAATNAIQIAEYLAENNLIDIESRYTHNIP